MDKQKEIFESWADTENLDLEKSVSGAYRWRLAALAWKSWQAALASQAQQPTEQECKTCYGSGCYIAFICPKCNGAGSISQAQQPTDISKQLREYAAAWMEAAPEGEKK